MSELDFTFLHAADLHLDSPLVGLSAYEGAPAERLRRATRDAFTRLVEIALEREVRFVVIAGDVFDGDWPDFNSGLWLQVQLRRLTSAKIPVFLIRGNHDAACRVSKNLRWAKGNGVYEFSDKKPATVRLSDVMPSDLDVALHGQSYADQSETENLARGYPERVLGAFNIGVLHTSLEGSAVHATYAPCSPGDLRSKGYDYWALGHIHKREIISEDPWIVFPGNVQGRHVRETGAKGASIVHVTSGSVSEVEHVDCDVLRWDHVRIDANDVEDENELLARLTRTLEQASANAEGRLVAARVTIEGATPLDAALRTQSTRIVAEVRAAALRVDGELWIEKIRIETMAPPSEAARGGLGGLAREMESATLHPEDAASLADELQDLLASLPTELSAELAPLDADALTSRMDPARRYLSALLDDAPTAEEEP